MAGGGERKIETLEQPEREQRIHQQAAGEGVERKQRGEADDDGARRSQRGRWRGLFM